MGWSKNEGDQVRVEMGMQEKDWETYLVLLGERVETSSKLSGPFAVARQVCRSDLPQSDAIFSEVSPRIRSSSSASHLATSMMSQIPPVHFEATMVKGVNHLVYDGVLHMSLAKEPILTEQDPVIR